MELQLNIIAYVDSTEDGLLLDTVEYGFIYLGDCIHSLVEGEQLNLTVYETQHSGCTFGMAFKNIISDPIQVWVELPREEDEE